MERTSGGELVSTAVVTTTGTGVCVTGAMRASCVRETLSVDGVAEEISFTNGLAKEISFTNGLAKEISFTNGLAKEISCVNGVAIETLFVDGVAIETLFVDGVAADIFPERAAVCLATIEDDTLDGGKDTMTGAMVAVMGVV